MTRKIWMACMGLILANLATLYAVYGNTTMGEQKVAAQNISRLISTYAEPESNPVFIVRAEDRCRFYGEMYCSAAESQRAAVLSMFTNPIKLSPADKDTAYYGGYLAAREQLINATRTYVSLLNTKPSTIEYLSASISFEEQAGVLVGTIVSNLYALQDSALSSAENSGSWVFIFGYICNLMLIVLVAWLARLSTRPKPKEGT